MRTGYNGALFLWEEGISHAWLIFGRLVSLERLVKTGLQVKYRVPCFIPICKF